MSATTGIEWTDSTWNPVTGCTKVSPGCDHCYAETLHERFHGAGSFATVTLNEARLAQPLRWRKPRRVFVNSMSDLFHQDIPDEYILRVFDVMEQASWHTFQILTKRHARMNTWIHTNRPEPLPNVWLGVSIEDQKWARIRMPALLDAPAAVRFLSCEPLLGPVDITPWRIYDLLGWVIVGGESGPSARPMQIDWARSLRDQCRAAGVPFLFKQWGAWNSQGRRVGKHAAGRILDGRTWDEYPETVPA